MKGVLFPCQEKNHSVPRGHFKKEWTEFVTLNLQDKDERNRPKDKLEGENAGRWIDHAKKTTRSPYHRTAEDHCEWYRLVTYVILQQRISPLRSEK